MKPLIIITLIVVFTLGACQQSDSNAVENITSKATETTELHDASTVKANAQADFEIDGMMCVMGCGSEIRKHLYKTKAVKTVSFDFIEGRNTNIASIEYNSDAISTEEITKTIEAIEGSEFQVSLLETEEELEEKSNFSPSGEQESLINLNSETIHLPDLSDILHALFF